MEARKLQPEPGQAGSRDTELAVGPGGEASPTVCGWNHASVFCSKKNRFLLSCCIVAPGPQGARVPSDISTSGLRKPSGAEDCYTGDVNHLGGVRTRRSSLKSPASPRRRPRDLGLHPGRDGGAQRRRRCGQSTAGGPQTQHPRESLHADAQQDPPERPGGTGAGPATAPPTQPVSPELR